MKVILKSICRRVYLPTMKSTAISLTVEKQNAKEKSDLLQMSS